MRKKDDFNQNEERIRITTKCHAETDRNKENLETERLKRKRRVKKNYPEHTKYRRTLGSKGYQIEEKLQDHYYDLIQEVRKNCEDITNYLPRLEEVLANYAAVNEKSYEYILEGSTADIDSMYRGSLVAANTMYDLYMHIADKFILELDRKEEELIELKKKGGKEE